MTRWIAVFCVLTAAVACGGAVSGCGNSAAGTCGASVPASCPTTTPSYQTDVAPIITTYCVKCHVAGGQEADKPLNSYSGLSKLSADVEGEVGGCDMPPSDEAEPTAAQRNAILAWLVCGAPDN